MAAHARPVNRDDDWKATLHLRTLLHAWTPSGRAAWRTRGKVLAELDQRLGEHLWPLLSATTTDRPRHSADNIIIRRRLA